MSTFFHDINESLSKCAHEISDICNDKEMHLKYYSREISNSDNVEDIITGIRGIQSLAQSGHLPSADLLSSIMTAIKKQVKA